MHPCTLAVNFQRVKSVANFCCSCAEFYSVSWLDLWPVKMLLACQWHLIMIFLDQSSQAYNQLTEQFLKFSDKIRLLDRGVVTHVLYQEPYYVNLKTSILSPYEFNRGQDAVT